MEKSMLGEINRLRQMTVAELRQEWQRLYGEQTRSRSRDYLWRRLAWRVQEVALGGLSESATSRLDELAPDRLIVARPLKNASSVDRKVAERPSSVRDPSLPTPGTVLTRQYHGREIRVLTLEEGFEWEGRHYRSLSALARAITGQKWNGRLFFGLTERKRRS